MLDAKVWMDEYTRRMRALFGGRVRMIGLQGSYGRGEADEGSDIDPVLILDTWTQKDSAVYRAALDQYPERAMICGFAGGAGSLRRGIGPICSNLSGIRQAGTEVSNP